MRGRDRDLMLIDEYARSGDPEAFSELVGRYENLVYSACHRILGNAAEAEEAAQECFLELARRARSVQVSMAGWLHRCATCWSIRIQRERRAREAREAAYAQSMREEGESCSWTDLEHDIDRALDQLPEEDRFLLVEHYLQRKPQMTLAREMDVSPATLSRKMQAAVESLRDRLKDAGLATQVAVLVAGMLKQGMRSAPPTLMSDLGKIPLSGIGARGRARTASCASPAAGSFPASTIFVTGMVIATVAAGSAFLLWQWERRSAPMLAPPVAMPAGPMPQVVATRTLAPVAPNSGVITPATNPSPEAFWKALTTNNQTAVMLAIQSNLALANARNQKGQTPLMIAVQQGLNKGSTPLCDLLLSCRCNLEARDDLHRATALHWAVYAGIPTTVRRLLQWNANPFCLDKHGRSPLDYARDAQAQQVGVRPAPRAGARYKDVEKALLAGGVSPEAMRDLKNFLAAVSRGDAQAVGKLLDARPRLADAKDGNGDGPVLRALREGKRTFADKIASDVNLDAFDAAALGKTDQLSVLVTSAANANQRHPFDSRTPLHWAAAEGREKAVDQLLASGADVNARDDEGRTPLDLADDAWLEKLVRKLREKGGRSGAEIEEDQETERALKSDSEVR